MIYVVTFSEYDESLLPRLEALSSPWRRERASTIKPAEGRLRSLSAGLLLDYALKAEGYPPLREVQTGPHGKPEANGVQFSLSHCRGLAACIIAERPVGIDAEPFRTFPDRLRRRVFTPEEIAEAEATPNPDRHFTRLWTLKESLLKARGIGMAEGPVNFAFSLRGGQVTGPAGYAYRLYNDVAGYSIATATELSV